MRLGPLHILEGVQRRLARLRSDLGYAVTMRDSGATELPDDDHHDPRD